MRTRTASRAAACMAAAAAVTLALPPAARASGFYILQQSPTSMGRSFAGDAAVAGDAATAFFNPAGMARLEANEVMAHVTLVRPSVSFGATGVSVATPGSGGIAVDAGGGDGGDPGSLALVGGAFLAVEPVEHLWAGLSLTAPFGLALEYDADYFGRYDSIETSLLTANVSPVVAYDVIPGRLAIGGGIDIQYADAKLTRAVPNPLVPGGPSPATDGLLELDGTHLDVGFNVGAHLTLGATRIGAHYRSGMTHDLDGSAEVSGLTGPLAGLNGDFDATTSIDLPEILTLGVAHAFEETGVRALAEVRFFRWSAFDRLDVDAENDSLDQSLAFRFRDSFVVSVGAEWDASPEWTLRAGASYDRTPTIDRLRNTSLPDADRIWLGAGATYAISDRFEVDAAVNAAIFMDGEVDRTETVFGGTPVASEQRTTGTAALDFFTAAIGVRWRF